MALSLGSPPVAVSDCPALYCPDFPLTSHEASDRLAYYTPIIQHLNSCQEHISVSRLLDFNKRRIIHLEMLIKITIPRFSLCYL